MTPDELVRGSPRPLRQSPSSANRNLFRFASNTRSADSSRYMTATLDFLEVVELGEDVVPALRRLLFEPEPSGLHHVRGRAAEALAALGRPFDVLADFLRSRQPIADPVERLGEEVVTGAAAGAITRLREEWVYRLLSDLAAHCCVAGVSRVLGRFIARTRSRSSSAPLAKTRCA
jgi:hypothetical protein